jgi:hypothetical protein
MLKKLLARFAAKVFVQKRLHQVMRGHGQPIRFFVPQGCQ